MELTFMLEDSIADGYAEMASEIGEDGMLVMLSHAAAKLSSECTRTVMKRHGVTKNGLKPEGKLAGSRSNARVARCMSDVVLAAMCLGVMPGGSETDGEYTRMVEKQYGDQQG